MDDAVFTACDQIGTIVIGNPSGLTQAVGEGTVLGWASEVIVVELEESGTKQDGYYLVTAHTTAVSPVGKGSMGVMVKEVFTTDLEEVREKEKRMIGELPGPCLCGRGRCRRM